MTNEDISDYNEYQNDAPKKFKLSKDSDTSSQNETRNESGSFSAEKFVRELMNVASKIPCDETNNAFNKNEIPQFYNRNKFERAQEFYRANYFASCFSMLLGLVVILSSPPILSILRMTRMSGCIMTAYRRYWATVLHVNTWFGSEFSLNSRSMQSLKQVKLMHNLASRKGTSNGIGPITQKDMVLTQFGFIGFTITRGNLVGIHDTCQEDVESLMHFWRVIGAILGIEDRFNLCRDSLTETRQICEILMEKHFLPALEEKDETFLEMASYVINGLWHTNPMLDFKVYLSYLYFILKPNKISDQMYFDLTFYEKLNFKFLSFVMFTLKFRYVKLYLNLQQNVATWIMKVFPFLAVRRFGYQNAMVKIGPFPLKEHLN